MANTAAVIKHTGMFDTVDRIYGDIEAAKAGGAGGGEEGGDTGGAGGGGGSFGGGGGFGGGGIGGEDLDFGGGEEGAGEEAAAGEEGAAESEAGGETGAIEAAAGGAAEEPLAESLRKTEKLLSEQKQVLTNQLENRTRKYKNRYVDMLIETIKPDNTTKSEKVRIYDKNLKMNKDIDNIIGDIDKMLEE